MTARKPVPWPLPARKRGAAAKAAADARPTHEPPPDAPWLGANASKNISINVPFPEPLMVQMDYLLEHLAIRSKSSFIREAVSAAAEREIEKLRRRQEAVRRIEEEDRRAAKR